MTKQEQNDIIKRVWTEHLQRKDDIPADLADKYSTWLKGKIQQASSLLVEQSPQPQQGQGQAQAQEQQPGQGAV